MERLKFIAQTKRLGAELLDVYYKPKNWEKSGKIYEAVGVRRVKRYFPTIEPLIKLVRKKTGSNVRGFSLERATLIDAKKYEKYTRLYEAIHMVGVIAFVPSVLGIINNLIQSENIDLDFNSSINGLSLVNCYAVMIQRYNRARIYRLLSRKQQD